MSSNNKEDKNKKPPNPPRHKPSKAEDSDEGAVGGVVGDPPEDSLESTIENIRKYIASKLSFHRQEDGEPEKILDKVSLDGVVDYIKSKNCKNIITMAGAGISTSAGIPDFRSPGSGLYHNLKKYNLPHPQAIFELGYFAENPKPFFLLAKELYPGSFKPTVCHYFIKMMAEKKLLLRHYSQNIDTLERVAGVPSDKIVEAHGTFYTGHCLECRKSYALEWMKERIFDDKIPTCEACPGVVKPDIVFFGENLPDRFHDLIEEDFPKCDLLIILGSSLQVQPFAGLVNKVPKNCPRLLINREKVGEVSEILSWMGLGGMDFDGEKNTRDVAWLGDCDEGCLALADKLGFGDELRDFVKKEHERIDQESAKEKKEDKAKEEAQSSSSSDEKKKGAKPKNKAKSKR